MTVDDQTKAIDAKMAPAVAKLDAARKAGNLEVRGFLDTIVEVIKDGKFTQADFPAVVTMVEGLYDEYIAPLDIPGIGPVLERLVDEGIKRAIRPALQAVFDRYVPA